MPGAESNAASLTRDMVIDAAEALVAEGGYGALSMRTLAERCGVATMTLYRHVRTKEELLGALAGRKMAELDLSARGKQAWDEELTTIFTELHAIFLEHPEIAEITARQHINVLSAYRGAEVAFDAMARAGVEGDAAVSAFSALIAFTVGSAQRHANREARAAQVGDRLAAIHALPPDEFPRVTALAGAMLTLDDDRRFEEGLQMLIAGIGTMGGK